MTTDATPAKVGSNDGLGPLPPSPAEVGDLILQKREHVQALGWGNREHLYPASQVRAYAAREVTAERNRIAQLVAGEKFREGKQDARRGPGAVGTWHESSPMGYVMRELVRVIHGA